MRNPYVFMGNFNPTADEMSHFLLATQRHVEHVEYFLAQLGISGVDAQTPHDITGDGNKLEPLILKALALDGRAQENVGSAVQLHRLGQAHHKVLVNPKFYEERMLEVAIVDMACAARESRSYNGDPGSYGTITQELTTKYPKHSEVISDVVRRMQEAAPPDLTNVQTLVNFPNMGIPEDIHKKIAWRFDYVAEMLRDNPQYRSI